VIEWYIFQTELPGGFRQPMDKIKEVKAIIGQYADGLISDNEALNKIIIIVEGENEDS